MNVLLIPEDFRNDQHVLKPLFVELFRTIGRPRARIDVLRDPLLGGVGEATKSRRLAEIVETYRGMTDVFILCSTATESRDGGVDWTKSNRSSTTIRGSSPRTRGKKSKPGRWPALTCRVTGGGPTSVQRST